MIKVRTGKNIENPKEITPEQVIQCDYGEIWVYRGKKYYTGGATYQGYVFKDRWIYEHQPDEICYIAEYALEDYMSQIIGREGLRTEAILQYERPEGYTHNDLLRLCNGRENVAEAVFNAVNWQSPETYYMEMLNDEESCQYYGITE